MVKTRDYFGCVSAIAVLMAASFVTHAVAQEAAAPSETAKSAKAKTADKDKAKADDAENTTVVVTGSRIRHKGADSPTPTTVVTSDMIKKSGARQVADVLNQLPALVISQSDQTSNANRDHDSLDNGQPGLNTLDLRGLGAKRTLVLVNGRRHVPGAPGSSAVDISAIPWGLIDRVEIVTGGASAQYGADAVAGVANFILKKNYEGLQYNIRYGNSTYGDMPSYDADVLWGKNFAGGRGNVFVYAFGGKSDGTISGQDRPSTSRGNPWWYRPNSSVPYTILDDQHSFSYSHRAVVLLGGNPYVFNDDGTMRAPRLGSAGILPTHGDLSLNSSVTSLATNSGSEFGGRYDNWLLSVPNDRVGGHFAVNYKLTDHINSYVELEYVQNKSHGQYGLWWEGGSNKIYDDNPFITPEMIAANGGKGFDDAGGLAFIRDYPELGKAKSYYERDLSQIVAGFDGDLPAFFRGHDWTWSGYFSYGKTEETTYDRDNVAPARYRRAIDAVSFNGKPTCRVNADDDPTNDDPACVPLNPFKPLTTDVINYLKFDSGQLKNSLEQYVVSGYATGGILTLPAGEVQIAVGGEYRKEANNLGAHAQYDPDNPAYVADYEVEEHPLKGKYDVKEVFAELSIPVLKDLPFAHRLSVDSAVRVADYSTAGRTTSDKYGLQWAPIKDIRFRGTYGTAVRAPNISETFTAASITGQWLSDPCNYYNLPYRADETQYTKANCAALKPANKNDYWLWLNVIKKGNPDLKVETAKTTTLGFVLQPRFMPNFTTTVDYYNIDMTNVVSSVEPQTILNKCVDQPSMTGGYCDLIVRDPVTHNLVSVVKQNINLARRATKGIDTEIQYTTNLASWGWGANAGTLYIDSIWSRLIDNRYTPDPDHPELVTDTTGVFGFPKLKGRTSFNYSRGKLSLGWTARFYSGMRGSVTYTADTYAPYKTKPIEYDDVSISYRFSPHMTLDAGLSNAFNKQPPRYPGAEAGGAYFGDEGWQAGVYDIVGRTGWINLRFTR